jgi:hypothetical protein
VRVELPATFLSNLKLAPVIAQGAKLTGLTITTRRDEAGRIVPNADAAGSLGCPFVVGAQAAAARPRTVPAGVDARPAPGSLPTTGWRLGLPFVALGLLLLAVVLRGTARG